MTLKLRLIRMNPFDAIHKIAIDGYGYNYFIGSPIAARKLRKLARSNNYNTEKLVDIVFDFTYKPRISKNWEINIKPLQSKYEITSICKKVKELNPATIVEIGTASGGTLFLWANVTKAKKIVSIDLPGGSFGGSYPLWKIP